MSAKPFAPATDRNRLPILEVLRREFADVSSVLEIGSGTGQHAVCFAQAMPQLDWQPSDLEEHHTGMQAWLDEAALPNVRAPLLLDVLVADMPPASHDAVFSANTAHIMSFDAVRKMFELVGRVLSSGGLFCLYGPFRRNGEFNTPSNANFDDQLRRNDPDMGVRDLEDLDRLGQENGLERRRIYAMPANNHMVVWEKISGHS